MFFTSQGFIYLFQPILNHQWLNTSRYNIKIATIRRFNDISGKQLGINILKANGDCRRENNWSPTVPTPPELEEASGACASLFLGREVSLSHRCLQPFTFGASRCRSAEPSDVGSPATREGQPVREQEPDALSTGML